MKVPTLARAAMRPLVVVSLFLAALLGSASLGRAGTMLTNGHPVHVKLPLISQQQTLFNGDLGYTIFVPPGATDLTVQFETAVGADLELVMSADSDVGTINLANRLADFRANTDGNGVATINVDGTHQPKLKSAVYYIGFFSLQNTGLRHEGALTATIDGASIVPERIVQESDFDSDLDGWLHVPGHRNSFLEFRASGGNPGGFARLRDGDTGGDEWFIASDKFLVNLLALPESRFAFDIARFSGDSVAHFSVEMRIYGADGNIFHWVGERPPTVNAGWQTFSATLGTTGWNRVAGIKPLSATFASPQRIEVRATFTTGTGMVGLDNFRLLARADVPARAVLPMVSGFAGGQDGWHRNYPADLRLATATTGDAKSLLLWNDPEGNPGGFLRIIGNNAGGDAFVASDEFEGNMAGLNAPRFEFDYRHQSEAGPTRPVQIRLIGHNATFLWTGAGPGDVWAHQIAYLTEALWTRVSGEASFFDTLSEVERIEISADQADGPEINSLDNFALLTIDTPAFPPTLTANPPVLNVPGVLNGPNPGAQVVHVTSGNGSLNWQAEATGELASRVTVSPNGAKAPSSALVTVDTQGLPLGEYQVPILFHAVGVNISSSPVTLNLSVGSPPPGTPQIKPDGVVHSATYLTKLSAGSLATVFGNSFVNAGQSAQAAFEGRTGDRLPTELLGVRVLIQDESGNLIAEAPLLYVDNDQINFQMPYEVFGLASVRVVVDRNGVQGVPLSVAVNAASPGIFTFGANRALAVNQNGSLNQTGSGVARGNALTVYLSGAGNVAPTWPSGRAAPSFPLVRVPGNTTVTIGGAPATIDFIGLAPGLVGVVQMNIRPGASTPTGNQPLRVTVNGFSSNEPLVTIQ